VANPQVENGHVDIANAIMEALARTRIPGEARQILDYILRKTYGWHKKEDLISLSQFCEGTGLNKTHICQGLNTLVAMNLITKKGKGGFTEKGKGTIYVYGFNKDFDSWRPLPKKVTLPKKVKVITEKGKRLLPNSGTTKENYTKENYTKESSSSTAPPSLFPPFFECEFFTISKEYHEELAKEYPAIDFEKMFKKLRDRLIDFPRMYARDGRGRLKALRSVVRNWCDREVIGPEKPVGGMRNEPKGGLFTRDGKRVV
jgi:phage replication O-like protein O